uniref:Uncharacterized protein n=1 Tax=viral metagenome TaxID=1070528 RepID=A0A6C0JDU5_9ZZZZ
MSKANASAKNRRAYGGNPPPPVPQQNTLQQNPSQSNTPNSGFTLQQVIAVIDHRLVDLETFVKETKNQTPKKLKSEDLDSVAQLPTIPESINSVQEVLDEFSNRFDMMAEEIGNLKEIVLKLQSYTMDVNRTLLEERIRVLSDLGENSTELFDLSSTTPNQEVVDTNTIENIQISTVE